MPLKCVATCGLRHVNCSVNKFVDDNLKPVNCMCGKLIYGFMGRHNISQTKIDPVYWNWMNADLILGVPKLGEMPCSPLAYFCSPLSEGALEQVYGSGRCKAYSSVRVVESSEIGLTLLCQKLAAFGTPCLSCTHSQISPPIAWALLSKYAGQGREKVSTS